MQGRLRPYTLWSIAKAAIQPGGETIQEDMRNLPARVAGSKLRNNAVLLAVRFRGQILNTAQNIIACSARDIADWCGRITYHDAVSQLVPAQSVAILSLRNIAEGFARTDNHLQAIGGNIPAADEGGPGRFVFDHTVLIPYSHRSGTRVRGQKYDGAMPVSMMGEEAEIILSNILGAITIGGASIASLSGDSVVVTMGALCFQSKELFRPMPQELTVHNIDTKTDPLILNHDLAKYLHLGVASKVAGEALLGGRSTERVTVELDSHRLIDGRSGESMRLLRVVNGGFSQDNDPESSPAIAVACASAPAEYHDQWYNLIEPAGAESATQGNAGKRLEITNIPTIENRHEAYLLARRVYELPTEKNETWLNREGVSATERKDVLIGGRPAAAQRLSRNEAVAVQAVVGSRKDRR
jgi:hypothetical protein